jgi:FtsP/CotA-like multicopper oxidase with cupredoxin domain
MKINTLLEKKLRTSVALLVVFLLGATSAHAVSLAAVEGVWTPPAPGAPITMWGFIPDPGSCTGPFVWDVGPVQIAAPGGSLTIDLRNCLTESVSIVIPGQNAELNPVTITDGQGRLRITSFTNEAAAAGGTATYTWNNLKSGTFLYQSGSSPAKQVHMGLYGALTVGTYPDAKGEALVLYSEIDPALHDPIDPPGLPLAATPLTYKPKYFLVNGEAYSSVDPVAVVLGGATIKEDLLIRFLNAGLMSHVPVMQGPYMKVVAEDGNPYPYPREQYSVLLAAGKTLDAIWHPTALGTYALYDRSLSLSSNGAPGGGLLVYLNVEIKPPFPWTMFIPAFTSAGARAIP